MAVIWGFLKFTIFSPFNVRTESSGSLPLSFLLSPFLSLCIFLPLDPLRWRMKAQDVCARRNARANVEATARTARRNLEQVFLFENLNSTCVLVSRELRTAHPNPILAPLQIASEQGELIETEVIDWAIALRSSNAVCLRKRSTLLLWRFFPDVIYWNYDTNFFRGFKNVWLFSSIINFLNRPA